MVTVESALRRVFLIVTLALALLAVVISCALVTRAQSPTPVANNSPNADGDFWFPPDGTNITLTENANQPVVTRLDSSVLDQIDPSTAVYRIFTSTQPGYQEFTPSYSILNGGHSIIMTATNVPLYTVGENIRFIVGYFSSQYYSLVTYPISVVWQTYLPMVSIAPVPPDGTNPCTAIPTTAGTLYTTTQDIPYRFFSLNLPVTSTLTISDTDYPVGGQMQLRTRLTSSCDVTSETVLNYTILTTNTSQTLNTYNLVPGNYLVRFNVDSTSPTSTVPFQFSWSSLPGIGPFEPNDTLCTAWPISPGPTRYAYPDDQYDFYDFYSSIDGGTIQAVVANYNILGQYQLIQENPDCHTYNILATADASTNVVTMTAGGLPPGYYALAIMSPLQYGFIGYNQSQPPYSFQIILNTTLLASKSPTVNTFSSTLPPIPLPSENGVTKSPPAEVSSTLTNPLPAP